MRFLKDIVTTSGLNVRLAYHQITYVEGDNNNMSLTLKIFASKEIFESTTDLQHLEVKNYYFKPDNSENSKNILIQGLDYLKTLPEYDGLIVR